MVVCSLSRFSLGRNRGVGGIFELAMQLADIIAKRIKGRAGDVWYREL
jgi:hypothetical protein